MKKAICWAIVVFMVFLAGSVLAQNQKPLTEEEKLKIIEKATQDVAILNVLIQIEIEIASTEELIGKIEIYRADSSTAPVMKEKISNNWLPVLREHLEAMERMAGVTKKFQEREDILTQEEVNREYIKVYPPELSEKVGKILQEIIDRDVFQKP